MKRICNLVAGLGFITLLSCCNKSKDEKVPNCIYDLIQSTQPSPLEIESVDEYQLNQKRVFLFRMLPECCDIAHPVYNTDCNSVCILGGFTGNTNCDGKQFDSTAVFVRQVWHK